MDGYQGPPPTWRQHAEDVGRQLLALDAMLAMTDPDAESMERFIVRLNALAERPDADELLEGFEAALTRYACGFARAAHGDRFRDVLAEQRVDLAAHVADYEPPDDEPPSAAR